MATTVDKKLESADMFLQMLQGPAIEIVVGTATPGSSPPVYWLPTALLSIYSTFFREEIHRATQNRIILADIEPGIFALFLRFIYHGGYSDKNDSETGNAGEKIPRSARAWILGEKLGAKSFMNHAIQHVYQGIGKAFFITPELIEWCQRNTTATSPLRRLFVDALIVHWSRNTNVVAKSDALNDYWSSIFDEHPDLMKEFVFGLKGEVRRQRVQSYFSLVMASSTPDVQGDSSRNVEPSVKTELPLEME